MALLLLHMHSTSSPLDLFDEHFNSHSNLRSSGVLDSYPLRVLEQINEEPIIIDYGGDGWNKKTAPWLSPNYMDLHLRSASLVSSEARRALQRHFQKPKARPWSAESAQKAVSMPVVWDPNSWELLQLAMATPVDEDRSFLDEAFC